MFRGGKIGDFELFSQMYKAILSNSAFISLHGPLFPFLPDVV